jgi:hypothetical protein
MHVATRHNLLLTCLAGNLEIHSYFHTLFPSFKSFTTFKAAVFTCTYNFCYDFRDDFLLLADVNEWIYDELYGEFTMFLRLNIRNCFTIPPSHPSKGKNSIENRSEGCKCKRANLMQIVPAHFSSPVDFGVVRGHFCTIISWQTCIVGAASSLSLITWCDISNSVVSDAIQSIKDKAASTERTE